MVRSFAGALILVVLLALAGLYVLIVIVRTASLPSFSTQSRAALDFVWFCVADGALSMVVVQLYRSLFPIRGHFHRSILHRWFGVAVKTEGYLEASLRAWADLMQTLGLSSQQLSPTEAATEFEKYSLERSARDLWLNPSVPPMYDLPLEQLCAQLSSAAEIALENPSESRHFLLCVVGLEGAPELLKVVPKPLAESEADQMKLPPMDNASSEALAIARARGVLVRLLQRRIDAFQIGAGAVWRRRLRAAVVIVGMVIGALLSLSGLTSGWSWSLLSYLLYGVLGGAIGGFIAMVFRDLTAIVELKRRQP